MKNISFSCRGKGPGDNWLSFSDQLKEWSIPPGIYRMLVNLSNSGSCEVFLDKECIVSFHTTTNMVSQSQAIFTAYKPGTITVKHNSSDDVKCNVNLLRMEDDRYLLDIKVREILETP